LREELTSSTDTKPKYFMNGTTVPSSLPAPELREERIRQRAYLLWRERGCPAGQDHDHWFLAQQELSTPASPPIAVIPAHADEVSPPLPHGRTLANRSSDPTHRFHSPAIAHDGRLDVVAGEARQRVRGRHIDSSLRPEAKKRK
jgi:hypothetical protein